jgi:uncharacterized protein (DUF427 family)
MPSLPPPSPRTLARHVARARTVTRERPPAGVVVAPGPGQESVWDYPRPPRVEHVTDRVRVEFGGRTVADTIRAIRVVETAGAPCYYVSPEDCALETLTRTSHWTLCEWKGIAYAYDVSAGGKTARAGAWSYPEPLTDLHAGYERIAGYFAFYAGRMDACYVGEERVEPQQGGYYGGWVTSRLVGPIKGAPGSEHW